MKRLAVSLLPLALMAAAHGQEGGAMSTVPAMADVNAVSPALGLYTQKLLLNELWQRPELSPRDRSIATLSTLIARNQQAGLPFHLELALDNGVTPAEVSELITHLAFYTGWGNAMSAIPVARAVFKARNLGEQEPALDTAPLVLQRKAVAGSMIGGIKETQEMLDFCGEHDITSDIELIAIQDINAAYERMLKSDVKYRFVIDQHA